MSSALVSIVVPTYDRPDMLREALDSALAQDYSPVELIVVADGATDETLAVLRGYGDSIRIVSQENRGNVAAVNAGFDAARGEFVSVLNDDDTLYEPAVGAAVDALLHDDSAVAAYGDVHLTDEANRPYSIYAIGELQLVDLLRFRICPAQSGSLYRGSAIEQTGGWDPRFHFGPDFAHWLQIGLLGRLAYIPEPLGTFRSHPGSVTSARADPFALARELVGSIELFFEQPDLPAEIGAVHGEALRAAYYMAGMVVGGKVNEPGQRHEIIDHLSSFVATPIDEET